MTPACRRRPQPCPDHHAHRDGPGLPRRHPGPTAGRGRLRSRQTHDAADGQIVDVDQPFIVNGKRLVFPRDPNGSPGETINGGCLSLPFMDHREVEPPGDLPFSGRDLLAADRQKLEKNTGRTVAPTGPGAARIAAPEERPLAEARDAVIAIVASRKFRHFARHAGRRVTGRPEGFAGNEGRHCPVQQPYRRQTVGAQAGADFYRTRLSTCTDYQRVQRILADGA